MPPVFSIPPARGRTLHSTAKDTRYAISFAERHKARGRRAQIGSYENLETLLCHSHQKLTAETLTNAEKGLKDFATLHYLCLRDLNDCPSSGRITDAVEADSATQILLTYLQVGVTHFIQVPAIDNVSRRGLPSTENRFTPNRIPAAPPGLAARYGVDWRSRRSTVCRSARSNAGQA